MLIGFHQWIIFVLVLIRLTAFLVASPLFSLRNIPNTVKIGLGLGLSIILFPQVSGQGFSVPDGLISLIGIVICETVTGLTAGMAGSFVFGALRVAGQYLDLHIGFAAAQLFDPMSSEQNTLIANFFHMLGVVLLFSLDSHHILIMGLSKSFQVLPLGSLIVTKNVVMKLVQVFLIMVTYALRIALPVISVLFLFDMALGFISKAIPQFNVLMVGFPLKIYVGVLAAALVVPVLGTVIADIFHIMEKEVSMIFGF